MAESARPTPDVIMTPLESSGIGAAEICYNATDDNQNSLLDEGCGVAQGEVQIMLAWTDRQADLDLFVSDPDGEIARAQSATRLGLTLSADCPSSQTGCSGQSYENVSLEEEDVPVGTYRVRVRVEQLPEAAISLSARLGVRTPTGTQSWEIVFFESGQEARMEFSVENPAPPDEEGPNPTAQETDGEPQQSTDDDADEGVLPGGFPTDEMDTAPGGSTP